MKKSRREFLKQSAVASAVVPYIWTSEYAKAVDKNSKPTIGSIGIGGSRGRYNRGGTVAMQAAKLGQMIACCDVDSVHTNEFNNKRFGGKIKEYTDYRELLEKSKPDIVTIGTPDHWHVPISIAALRAGCDVYCEKPLTLTIDEGKEISKVVKETGRVFQVGTQQRTENGKKFLKAVAMAHLGYLGKNLKAYVAIGGAPKGKVFETQEAPKGLDWDFWLGPAAKAPYMKERRAQFRWFLEYSGGKMTDWGAHHIDIAQWALGCDKTGPIEVNGKGKFPPAVPENFDFGAFFEGKASLPNAFNAATEFSIDLKFANGSVLNVNHHYKQGTTDFGNGILLVGDKGRIFVNRERLAGKPVEQLTDDDNQKIDAEMIKLYKGKQPSGHMANFFDCCADRSEPVSDVHTHHRIMTSCHLCNITLMLGRSIKWDPEKQMFPNDDQANALMSRPSRKNYL